MTERSQNQVVNFEGISLTIKREDMLHPEISGNKFRKLKYNILEAKKQKQTTLLTFGGAYSNHIAAVAAVGKVNGFKTIGIIRGDELAIDLKKTLKANHTLELAHQKGMQFQFVSREQYRTKQSTSFLTYLNNKFGDFYSIPEGGTNNLAIKGCEEILANDDEVFDYVCTSVGTGGTISGLINSAKKHQKIIGFSSLKGDFLNEEIKKITANNNWELINNYHFGGYGKIKPELITFINQFKDKTDISLDPIYTGKMLFGILDMVKKGHFEKESKILAIHTGGLQGIIGMNEKLRLKNQPLIIE